MARPRKIELEAFISFLSVPRTFDAIKDHFGSSSRTVRRRFCDVPGGEVIWNPRARTYQIRGDYECTGVGEGAGAT